MCSSQVKGTILQFALLHDDLKMFCVIHDAADFGQLQNDIDSLW